MIPYGRHCIDEDDAKAVIRVLKSDYVTQGPTVEKFERTLAEYCGARYAVVFNSGTSALHSAYGTLELNIGDEFITSPITFVATANAGLYLGARPVFVDVDIMTGNIDVEKIKKNITPKTRMIVPVHYAGNPVNMEYIREIADSHGLMVVEDACHALGSMNGEWRTGGCRYSDMVVMSFHPVKHITTGEGGAVLTNNEQWYKRLKTLCSHGIVKKDFEREQDGEWYYEMQNLGYNYRMTDIQAALGISQLKKADGFIKRRRAIARRYREVFEGNPYFDILQETEGSYCSYHLFPILLKNRCLAMKAQIFGSMKKRGIGVQVHYIPVYTQPYYRRLGFNGCLCPNAEMFYQKEISIPVYPAMKDADVEMVIETTMGIFEEYCAT